MNGIVRTSSLAWLYAVAVLLLLWNLFAAYSYGIIFWNKLQLYNTGDVGDGMALLPALAYVLAIKALVSGAAGSLLLMMRSHQAKYLFVGPLIPIIIDFSPWSGVSAFSPIGYALPIFGTLIAGLEIGFSLYCQRIGVIVTEKSET